MDLAKVSAKGQITIPVDIRKKLNLRTGDKVLFIEREGQITMVNATMNALREAQEAFTGAAEEAGFRDEQDVINYLKELRRERAGMKPCE